MTIAVDLGRKATKQIMTAMANNNGYHQFGFIDF